MKLIINNVPGFSGEVDVAVDKNGTPIQKFWRDRLKDAKTDHCVEIKTSRTKAVKQEQAK